MTEDLDRTRAALIGSYLVEREIARGGMATVYLATDLKHERKVAVKVLSPELAAAVGHERFLREIKTTAQLSNPHILPLLDSGESAGILYYVMPFVEGESLRDRLKRDKELSVAETIEIACDVAAALGYAHGRGVIHRDIKPENIMLSTGEAVVMDFGIARALTKAGGEALTSTGLAVGTPAYMSPEQSTGSTTLDARTDIYSLGTVVFEMLAGEPPYTGPNPQAVIAKRLINEVPRINVLREIPRAVEHAVRKALARSESDRWASAAEFAAALRGERVATQASVVLVAPRWRKITAAGIGVVVLAIALVLALPKLRDIGGGGATNAALLEAPSGMVLVPGGAYALFGGSCLNCAPARSVSLDSFYIDRSEVTTAAYRAYASATRAAVPATAAASPLVPIAGMMWPEADAYCRARDSLTRLPTDEEWEAAALGKDGRAFPWGSDWSATRVNLGGARAQLVAVGSLAGGASPAGALDMIGNAWEWTSSPGPLTDDGRRQYILRGGAFDTPRVNSARDLRAWLPERVGENLRGQHYGKTGFRCLRRLR